MSYTPNAPNAYDVDLIPREVRNQYFEEILLQSPMSMFMGNTPESVIQVIHKENGTGPTATFGFSREIDYKMEILDYDQVSGKGQQLKFYEDTIEVHLRANGDQLKGIQMTKLMTPIDVFGCLRSKLITAHKRAITYRLLKSATFDSYGPAFTAGPITDRVQYGTEGVFNANMITAANALAGSTYNTGGTSVAAIKHLEFMATNGGQSYEIDKRISPYMLKTREGFPSPFYVYFMSPASFKSLENDPDWKNYYYRGVIEATNQPSGLTSAFFKGQIGNTLIYVVHELGNFKLGTAQGFARDNAWNLFCGAQAFGLIWHGTPWFTEERTNHGREIEMFYNEFRGQKAIKFPSFQNENVDIENGIIHHIVRLTPA
jgi:hypothetical protein